MQAIPKILIIDDDKFFLEFYRAELAQEQVFIEFASDGVEGLQKARTVKPDVIILDVILPKKDGFEVVEELKKDPTTKDIPVLISSTLGSESDKEKLIKMGVLKFFNKLAQLPKDISAYIMNGLRNGFASGEQEVAAKTSELSPEQIKVIFGESLKNMESSLSKLLGKPVKLEDMNISAVPFSKFKIIAHQVMDQFGTIFIYSQIKAKEPGLAIMSMKRNSALALIKLIEQGAIGKEIGLSMSDRVIEELVNIIVNAFLTKLSSCFSGTALLTAPSFSNPVATAQMIDYLGIEDDHMVIFFEHSYRLEGVDLNFNLFILFGSGVINAPLL